MIILTNVVQPKTGAIMLYHCRTCKQTVIIICEYAKKPDQGEAWRVEDICIDDIRHNLNYPKRFAFELT